MTTLPVEQVGARTWAIETRHVGGKVGVVVGDERTLVIDAGADPVEGSAVAETATSLGRLPLSVRAHPRTLGPRLGASAACAEWSCWCMRTRGRLRARSWMS